ncbi:MAG TPA: leucyl aminopeptidase [Trueperaceae bacterium]
MDTREAGLTGSAYDRVATRPAEATPPPVLEVASGDITRWAGDAVVVNLFEGVTAPGGATGAVDRALDGELSELIEAGDVSGRAGQVSVLWSRGRLGAKRVIVVGLGPREAFDAEGARRASAAAVKRANELGARDVATIAHGAGIGGLVPLDAGRATLEGAGLALYDFRGWKSTSGEGRRKVAGVTLLEADATKLPTFEEAARWARAAVRGAYLARDLVNTPANVATPAFLAEAARGLAGATLKVRAEDESWAAAEGMGALLAVAKGSVNPPRFIVMEHDRGVNGAPTLVLVGKGVTFDTGGFSLKTRDGMVHMKGDMAGAAAVIGTMAAVSELDLPIRVVGICPCVENMADANAYRPSDVLVARGGTSIEVISTDAEGRLALADALSYAATFEPTAVIDIATLTGSSIVALGAGVSASLFANDDALAARVEAASGSTGERVWRMPLFDEYRRTIESQVADMKNSGGARGGVGTAAVFLERFVSYPWAHLDMAGLEHVEKPGPRHYLQPGASGYGVRLLLELVRSWESRERSPDGPTM